MKTTLFLAGAAAAMLLGASIESRAASLVANIDVSAQRMTVIKHGRILYSWPVSTARKGYVTPRGSWRPKRLHRMWYSKKYYNSPMPYSVFYNGGFAVHGTNAVRHLGRPASHGCVRLATGNAATFYSLVKEVGAANTRIVVSN
jgi:lipoprotein-anchoring transpeptidase ErfK/SrfK